jgi:tetratricopeptide (TPR) repeat protein
MAEAQQTSNPLRLFMLALDIREALEKALKANPNDVEVLLDLVRFHAVSPKIVGGDMAQARMYAATLATLDEGLGHFAAGYIAYREKQFGVGRRELREAVRLTSGAHHVLALQWLGWLSQESQQYADAFAIWEQLRASDPKAPYEIARTAVFCGCERERGKAALAEYLKAKPKDAEARKLVAALK